MELGPHLARLQPGGAQGVERRWADLLLCGGLIADDEATEVTEETVSQEQRRNEDERRAVRLVGARSAPTAAMNEGANTNRTGAVSGLYLHLRSSLQAAFGGQSNDRISSSSSRPFVSFVVKETPFASVSSFLL